MRKVTGHPTPKRGPLRRITIDHAANGFSISSEHGQHPEIGEYGPRAPEDPPSVFTKHSQAHKHLKALMAKMRPDADEQMEPGMPPTGSQA